MTGKSKEELDSISGAIIDSAIAVHRALGPGLLESSYEVCLDLELRERGLSVQRQVTLPVEYRGERLDAGYRLDLLVEQAVIVELKAVEMLHPIHRAQLLAYLKLSKLQLGLLINFNVELLKHGVVRMVNGL